MPHRCFWCNTDGGEPTRVRTSIRLSASLFPALLVIASCAPGMHGQEIQAEFERQTGLAQQQLDDGTLYLGKTHRNYPVLFRPEMGEVWGRWAARVAMGEIGREFGGIAAFLTGGYQYVDAVVGGPLDRLLSQAIGQPLTIIVVLRHGKRPSRLDILSPFSTVSPTDLQREAFYIGFKVGSVYTSDHRFAERIRANQALMNRLPGLRSQYIRVDEYGVTFIFAGTETDYSAMINENGGYPEFLNAVMDSLADIADAIS